MTEEEYGYFVFDHDDYIPPFEPIKTLKEVRSSSPKSKKFIKYVLFECNGIQIYTQTPLQWYPFSSFSYWRYTWKSFVSVVAAIYTCPYILSNKFSSKQ